MAKKQVPTKKSAPVTKGAKSAKPESVSLADLEKQWEQSRVKAPTRGNFDPPDIPDGDYLVQVEGAKMTQYKSGNKKGQWYFAVNYRIVVGEHKGVQLRSSDDVSDREIGNSGNTSLDLLSGRLQVMADIKGLKLGQLPDLAKQLSDPKSDIGRPYLSVSVKNNFIENEKGESRHFQNVYVNELVDYAHVKAIEKQLG